MKDQYDKELCNAILELQDSAEDFYCIKEKGHTDDHYAKGGYQW